MLGAWLCPALKKAIESEECIELDCGTDKERCPVFVAFMREKEPEVWEKKRTVWNKIVSKLFGMSMKLLDKNDGIGFQAIQEEYKLVMGATVEVNLPDCGFRAYFLVQDGHPTMLQDEQVDRVDAVVVTTFGVIKNLYIGKTTVYDYRLKKWITIDYDPSLASMWGHLNLISLSDDRDVLSAAYLFSKELYTKAFPVIRKHIEAKGILKSN